MYEFLAYELSKHRQRELLDQARLGPDSAARRRARRAAKRRAPSPPVG